MCVVWTEASGVVASALTRVLRARGMEPVAAGSAHAALAELCLAQRAGVRSALIVSGVREVARVVSAVERFAPGAVVWIYEEGANPPLRPLVLSHRGSEASAAAPGGGGASDRPAKAPAPKAVEDPKRNDPLMRLVRENGLKRADSAADSSGQESIGRAPSVSSRDILNDAELEMLLSGEKAMEDRTR